MEQAKLDIVFKGILGNRGASFFVPKGALTHHPKGRWYCLRQSCALRGGGLLPKPIQWLPPLYAQESLLQNSINISCGRKPVTDSFVVKMAS